MRVFTNGRGCHPSIDAAIDAGAPASHQWCLDGTSAAAGAEDSVARAYDLATVAANPSILTDSDIGFAARRFNGTTQWLYGASSGDPGGLVDEFMSIIMSFRIPLQALTTGTVLEFAKPDGTSINIQVILNSTKKLTFKWTDDAGATAVANSAITLPQGKWIHLGLTRATGSVIKVSLWGTLAETLTQTGGNGTVCANFGTERWSLGANTALASPSAFDVSSITIYPGVLTEEEMEDQLRRMKLLGFDTYKPARVKITDKAGALKDMSVDLPGGNWLKSATIADDAADDILKATVKLFRNIGDYSLSKYSNNPANRYPLPSSTAPGVDETVYVEPGGSGVTTEMLAYGRLVTIDSCRMPLGVDPVSADWQNLFRGIIDHVAWGDEKDAIINCLDEGALLRKAFIMTDEEYGSDTSGVSVQSCVTSIISAAADAAKIPRWGLASAPVAGFPFTKDGDIPTLKLGWTNGFAWPDADPGWNLNLWKQNRESVLSAISTLVEQDALVCRMMFNPALATDTHGGWYLTLFEPPLLRKWIDLVLTSHELMKLTNAEISAETVRTLVSVVFMSEETSSPTVPTIPSGTTTKQVGSVSSWNANTPDAALKAMKSEGYLPCRYTVMAEDLDTTELGHYAADEYGHVPCETIEPIAQNINNITEAQRLGVSILRTLCYPKAEYSGQFEGMPELECYDSVRLRADSTTGNGTSDMDLSVVNLSQDLPGGTTLALRGTPSGGTERHMRKLAGPGTGNAPAVDVLAAVSTLPMRMRAGSVYGMITNGQYARTNIKTLMCNGDFSMHTLGDSHPPDGWTIEDVTGTTVWNEDFLYSTTVVESGVGSIATCKAADANASKVALRSNYCPIAITCPGIQLEVRAKVAAFGAGNDYVRAYIEWFDSAGVIITTDNTITQEPASANVWQTFRGIAVPPASTRFFRVSLQVWTADTGDERYFNHVQATPLKPSFSVQSASAQTGLTDKTATKVTLGTENQDYGGNFASSTFTCPEPGWYEFSGYVTGNCATTLAAISCALYKNTAFWIAGTIGVGGFGFFLGGSRYASSSVSSGIVWMARGDTVDLYAAIEGTGSHDVDTATLNGRLVSVE